MIEKVNMIILMQPDLDVAVSFYTELGLKKRFYVKNKWAEFDLDGVNIGLCPTPQEGVERRTGIVLQVKNVRDFYAKKKTSISFVNKPVEALHGIMTSIKDPGGNVIDVYQPTPEKVQSAARDMEQKLSAKDSKSCCKMKNKNNKAGCSKSSC